MTFASRVHAEGGTKGQDLGYLTSFVVFFLLLKNDILFSISIFDRGPDPQCPRSSPRLCIQVSYVYCFKIDMSYYYTPSPGQMVVGEVPFANAHFKCVRGEHVQW